MKDVFIVAACRTPIGTIGGQFKSITALDLSIPVMEKLKNTLSNKGEELDEVIWGCNYQRTYLENNLARVALLKSGIPESVPGITVHRNCTSSMSSIQMGFYQIRSGEGHCIMAGGADSMSTAPHMVFNARYGQKFGHMELRDSMWDSLTNLGVGPAMGITAENIAEKYNISREEQDVFALNSQKKAVEAIEKGYFEKEIVSVTVKNKKSNVEITEDEYPKPDVTLEGLTKLKPAFLEEGTVTPGNASGMNDGGAGVLIMGEDAVNASEIKPLAKIISVATTGVPPEIMGIGPVSAIEVALKKAHLSLDDIDLFEINEAFAAQCIACEKELNIPTEKLNVNGGAIALGHPVGATGARLVVSLLHELKRQNKKYGIASLCAGGGMGTAIIIESL